MLLLDRILESVESDPAAPACVSGGEVLSYRGFLALWSVATRYLHEQGIGAGRRLAAALVPSGALDWTSVARFTERELDVRAPSSYFEVEALPRNAMGKLLRFDLRAWIATDLIGL